ncbi:MAG: type II secretion system F family protein [Candidatus Methylacidiphilales bacterium]|nr:type II secretion system F family protein [Candidatus Methylacidiphilales bacterium]
MPKFTYSAVDSRGVQQSGTVDASDTNEATVQIRQLGLFPTRVAEISAQAAAQASSKPKKVSGGGGRVKSKVLTTFTRQLATLIDAGLPILKSLDTLIKQERNVVLKRAMQNIAASVESGSTFSESLAQHPRIFNKLYVNMVKAGEIGGVPEVILQRLAEFQEKSERIKAKVFSAMIYPAVVLFIALAILAFLLVFIVPRFQAIFQDLLQGKPLPELTQAVINLSGFVTQNIIVLSIAAVIVVIAFRIFAATPAGVVIIDRIMLNAPILGDLVRKTSIARFSRTLGTLVSSGVPILQALNITKETAGNVILSNAIAKVYDSVKEGEPMVTPLEASGVFPPMVVSMIQVGEETGQLDDMLIKVADVYDVEVDNSVSALTSLLEPIMIVLLALIVGTIVIALFLPLVTIVTQLGQTS